MDQDAIYPTHVGMNRACILPWERAECHLPHTCGDEPVDGLCTDVQELIYPTHVGMNR